MSGVFMVIMTSLLNFVTPYLTSERVMLHLCVQIWYKD